MILLLASQWLHVELVVAVQEGPFIEMDQTQHSYGLAWRADDMYGCQYRHPSTMHTLVGSTGRILARTLPSLSVLIIRGSPVLLLQQPKEETMDCRWPSSRLASTASEASAAAADGPSLDAVLSLSAAGAPSAPAAAGGALTGRVVAHSTSPKRSEKKTCLPSAENVHAVDFLPLFLQSHPQCQHGGDACPDTVLQLAGWCRS